MPSRRSEQIHTRPVLVVDDDFEFRRDVCSLLADAGVPVVGASDGSDALRFLRFAAVKPGLIVLDLMMPRMDGVSLAETLSGEPELRTIPILVVTAATTVNLPHASVAERLSKPVLPDVLLDAVQRHAIL